MVLILTTALDRAELISWTPLNRTTGLQWTSVDWRGLAKLKGLESTTRLDKRRELNWTGPKD